MLLVRTVVRESKIDGVGLFADEPIRKGQHIWKFKSGFDLMLDCSFMLSLPNQAASRDFEKYAYRMTDKDIFIYCADNAKFINHSKFPNLQDIDDWLTVALMDIEVGEEFTIDYETIDADFYKYKDTLK